MKIEPVLKSVFKLLNDRLPKHSTINEILIESRSLSHLQLAEVLTTTSNNTLHSDGTTKFNHKFQSYQVATEEGAVSLGLQVCSYVCGSRMKERMFLTPSPHMHIHTQQSHMPFTRYMFTLTPSSGSDIWSS